MNLRYWKYACLAATSLVVGLGTARTAEPERQRAAPIVFSAPKSDTVSSNLNQLDPKASPFKALESDLKKPFEIFDWGQPAGGFRPPVGPITPSGTPANNRRIKELMEKRAEMLMLGPDGSDVHSAEDDPSKTPEDGLEAASSKLKTPLDRYYDRLDRERSSLTNQVRKPSALEDKAETDGKDLFGRPLLDKPLFGELETSMSSMGRLRTNTTASTGFFSDRLQPKTFDDLLDRNVDDPTGHSSSGVKESRVDQFRSLLDGPAFVPASNPNYYSPGQPAVGTDVRAAPVLPWSTWSAPSATAATPSPRDSFTQRAGLVGAPAQIQSLPNIAATTPSLNPAPPPIVPPKAPVSSFSIPKRQF